MVKKLVYLLVASIIGSFLYLRSLNHAYLVKEIELMKEAFSAGTFGDYLGYTSPYFRERLEIEDADFRISVYEVLAAEDGRAKTGVAVFVSHLNEERFRISEDFGDQNDRTDLAVASDRLIYSHLEEMKLRGDFISQSYGYRKYGGYYYLFYPDEEAEYHCELSDYEGNVFSEFSFNFEASFPKHAALEEWMGFGFGLGAGFRSGTEALLGPPLRQPHHARLRGHRHRLRNFPLSKIHLQKEMSARLSAFFIHGRDFFRI